MAFFINTLIQLFALLSPFGSASVFLASTSELTAAERRKAAVRATIAIIAITLMIYLTGRHLLRGLGITLDAFRIGTGVVLFLTAISIIRGIDFFQKPKPGDDFAIVPFAIPITVGPGTIGYLMVISADVQDWSLRISTLAALFCVITLMFFLLFFCDWVERILGRRGMQVINKLFGLILSAMAAQIVMDGVRNVLLPPST